MPVNKKLHKSLKKFSNQKEEKLITISGELGLPLNGQMLVDVPNREGFVFVRLRNNTSEVIQAYNSEVSNSYGLPVLVARQNNIYKIIGRDQERYRDWGNTPYLPKHGGQHSFNNELGMGADVAWIYSPQFMPLLVYPSGSSGSPTLQVAPYPVRDLSGNWKYTGNTGTPSTLPYNPTTGSRAIMALVYLDTVSGNPLLLVNSGTYFSDSLTGTNQVAPYIPRLNDPNGIPLAAIRLLSGTSTLTWNNLYDVRPFLQVFPTGSSGSSVNPPITGSVVYQDDYVTKGSALVFNFRNGLIATASGTNAQIDVDFGTGTNQALRGSTTPYDIGAIPNDGWISENNVWTFYNRTQAYTNDPAIGVDVVLNVANTTDFVAGSHVAVSSGAGSEDTFVKSIVANTSITVNQLQIDHNTTNPLITLLDTITINADVTATVKKYYRIKLTQTTTKYWVVKSSAVAAGTTTITFVHSTDFTLANAAISSTYYSPLDNPSGWPDWFAYDGAPLGFSSEPTLQTYKWRSIGNTMFVSYSAAGASTSNATTFTSAAPVTPAFTVSCLNTTATDNSVLLAVPSRTSILTTNVQTLTHRTDLSTGAWTAANTKAVGGIIVYQW